MWVAYAQRDIRMLAQGDEICALGKLVSRWRRGMWQTRLAATVDAPRIHTSSLAQIFTSIRSVSQTVNLSVLSLLMKHIARQRKVTYEV